MGLQPPDDLKIHLDYWFIHKTMINSVLNYEVYCEPYSFFERVSANKKIFQAKYFVSVHRNKKQIRKASKYDVLTCQLYKHVIYGISQIIFRGHLKGILQMTDRDILLQPMVTASSNRVHTNQRKFKSRVPWVSIVVREEQENIDKNPHLIKHSPNTDR